MCILYIPIICIYDNVCDVLIINSQQGFASFYALSLFSGEASGNNTCRECVSETSMISFLLHTSWHCERIGIPNCSSPKTGLIDCQTIRKE